MSALRERLGQPEKGILAIPDEMVQRYLRVNLERSGAAHLLIIGPTAGVHGVLLANARS